MTDPRAERRLSAVLSADAVGYSRLVARDEIGDVLVDGDRIAGDAVNVAARPLGSIRA